MIILGVSCYFHDASACIIRDGKLIAAVEEERFTRRKHDISFPINSITYCMKEAGVTANNIDYVGFYEKPLLKFERFLYQNLEHFPKSLGVFLKSMPSWINEKLRIRRTLRKKIGYKGSVFYVPHHLAHAASSYLVSPFKESAILTTDGVGEWATTALGYAKGNKIVLNKQIYFPHSIGLLYSTVTAYLGFSVNNSEYKVMGLSPYGDLTDANTYYQKFKQIVDVKKDGSYAMNMSYFCYTYKEQMPNERFCELFGGPIRKSKDELTQRHKDIAAGLQKITEDIMFNMLNALYEEAKSENLCMAGGVALNSVANGKILSKTPFKKLFIQPAAGDGGTSLGAAYYVYNSILGNERNYVLKDAYLGPSFKAEEIKEFLGENAVKYSMFKDDKELINKTAKLIRNGNVIGWFQGRMEWGPRALGARSILSDPTREDMKDILNLKVKHREKFRPFAPVVCEDDAKDYFECDLPIQEPTDFMLMVYPIKKNKQKLIPAVTHIDGSGRLQTIRRNQNPLYYDLIKEFGKLSGVPILINTSFNIRGEPIILSPYDAYKCMMGTGIDYLVIDKFLIKREDNSKDMWDSEKYATD